MLRCIITATKALPPFLRFYSFLYKRTPKKAKNSKIEHLF